MKTKIMGILVVTLLIATVLPVLGSFEVNKNNIRKSPVARDCPWTLSFEQSNELDDDAERSKESLPRKMSTSKIEGTKDKKENIDPDIRRGCYIDNEGIQVEITKPRTGYLYLFDREIAKMGLTVVVGKITIEVTVADEFGDVDIYIDNDLEFSDYTLPYSRLWNEQNFGKHTIKAVVSDDLEGAELSDEVEVFIINLHKDKPHVVINEIMADPTGDDAGNEWMELYNSGDDVNVDRWSVSNSDGKVIAMLPDWLFPHDTYMVVHFGTGVNDANFSNGNATFYTNNDEEVLDDIMDECAIYSGYPGEHTIIDFISYCYEEDYESGLAYESALSAAIWNEKEYFNPLTKHQPPSYKIPVILEGDTIGRGLYSNDTNTPQDWDITGGKDAFQPTSGRPNADVFGFVNVNMTNMTFGTVNTIKNWTVMIYIAADNDLEDESYQQLNDIEARTGTDENMNIVFEIDGFNSLRYSHVKWNGGSSRDLVGIVEGRLPSRYDGSTFRGFLFNDNHTGWLGWNITRIPTLGQRDIIGVSRSRIKANSLIYAFNPKNESAYIEEINTGEADPLTDFINWAKKYAPAKHYFLILSSHGQGWKGFSIDITSQGDILYMHELKTALDNGNIHSYDIIGFDSCYMGMVEVGYQIKHKAGIMVASEESELSTGWDCSDIFKHLQENPGISEDQLVTYIVDSYDRFQCADPCRTLSAVRLGNAFDELINQIDYFGDNLKTGMEDWGDFEDTPFATHDNPSDNCQTDVSNTLFFTEHYGDRNFIDLYHFAQKIGSHGGIYSGYKKGYDQIMNMINQTVIHEKHGDSHHPNTHGLSIYFPRNQNDTIWFTPCSKKRREERPFDWPLISRVKGPTDKYAIYAEDFTIEWGKVPYFGAPPHPWPHTPNLFFREDTQWDEFLHRYYKPCADAGKDQEFTVDDCDDCVRVTLNGGGSSSVDDDLTVHRYTWDFDATIDSKAGMNPDEDDMDRSGIDDLDDELDAEGREITHEFCVGTHIVTLTVWDDHHLKDDKHQPRRTNNKPNEHWKTDQDVCIITVTCQEDDEEPDTHITSPQDGATVTSPINVIGYATDYGGSGVSELDYLLEWDGGSYYGDSIYIDPPEEEQGFTLGPLYLEDYLDLEDVWLKITIYAIDAAGNTGSDSITVYRAEEEDTTPPITTATFDPELRVVTLTAYDPPHGDDPVSGVCATYYYIDDGTTQEYFEPFSLPEGTHDVTFWSVDCADNVEDPNTETFG